MLIELLQASQNLPSDKSLTLLPTCSLPIYNGNYWLGIKHQVSYSSYLFSSSHLFLQGLQLSQECLNRCSPFASFFTTFPAVGNAGIVIPLFNGQGLQSLPYALYLLAECVQS